MEGVQFVWYNYLWESHSQLSFFLWCRRIIFVRLNMCCCHAESIQIHGILSNEEFFWHSLFNSEELVRPYSYLYEYLSHIETKLAAACLPLRVVFGI